MTDLIKKAAKKATKQRSDGDKKEVVWTPDADLVDDVKDMISSGAIAAVLDPVVKAKKAIVGNKLFDRWTQAMWADKKLQPNPRVAISKDGTTVRDMAFLFMVKFRTDALKSFIPNELEEDQTAHGLLLETLTSDLVGLSKENAEKIIVSEEGDEEGDEGEFAIEDRLDLVKSFNAMYYGGDEALRSAAEKLLTVVTAEQTGKRKTVSIPFFTDEEKAVLVTKQVLSIKEGFMERVFTYCETVEQLRNLLRFVKVSIVCQNFEFAIGDEPEKCATRMEESVKRFLTV